MPSVALGAGTQTNHLVTDTPLPFSARTRDWEQVQRQASGELVQCKQRQFGYSDKNNSALIANNII